MIGKKTGLLIFLFLLCFFLSCKGTPPINDLNTPMGLSCKLSPPYTSNIVTLVFYAYNPEPDFTGFNVYISTTHSTWESMQSIVNSHATSSGFNVAARAYIIPQIANQNVYPTIPAYSITGISTGVKKIEYTLQFDASSQPLNITGGANYYIGVTAVDFNNVLESKISNVIRLNSTTCQDVP